MAEEAYAQWARTEVAHWRARLLKPPSVFDHAAKGVQVRITRLIPEPVHATLTTVIEGMTRTILTGANLTTARPLIEAPLSERDRRALAIIDGYRKTAALEGGVAGAGGFWLALADFPALLVIKMKLLFDLSAVYGHEADRFEERLFILQVFQLAFSNPVRRRTILAGPSDWEARTHPTDFENFDWRSFQQEYRDYIDLAKLAQLIPARRSARWSIGNCWNAWAKPP